MNWISKRNSDKEKGTVRIKSRRSFFYIYNLKSSSLRFLLWLIEIGIIAPTPPPIAKPISKNSHQRENFDFFLSMSLSLFTAFFLIIVLEREMLSL